MQELLKKIDFYKDYYDKSFALSREQLENLKDYYRVSLTYSSNAIEGNTLTLSETQVVIEEGITVGGKTLREHNEAYGHGKAFDLMVEIAKGQGNVVTEENLLALHRLFYQKIDVSFLHFYTMICFLKYYLSSTKKFHFYHNY